MENDITKQTCITATAKVREIRRRELRDYFDDFLARANGEELAFMKEVMTSWESIYSPSPEELHIAAAFALEMEGCADADPTTTSPNADDGELEWIETPEESTYRLSMYEGGGEMQGIELTREEYITLKGHLAQMRGLVKTTN